MPKNGRAYTPIEQARLELEQEENRYLRSHGWTETSDTPGCLWLWRKATPKGEVLLVDKSTAISMQAHSCAIRGNEW